VCLPTGTEKKFDVTLNSLKETKKPCSMAVFAFVLLRDDRFPWGFGVADGSNHVGSLNRLGEMLCFFIKFSVTVTKHLMLFHRNSGLS
jgi:hypothetical protein